MTWWRRPFVLALLAGLLVLAAAFAPVVLRMHAPEPAAPRGALPAPWQVEVGPGGQVQALGLRLPGSTLADAQARWGDDMPLALIASRQQGMALEAYVERWEGGGVTGRLVLATEVDATTLQAWQARAPRQERIDADAARWALSADDRAAALRQPVTGLSFVPAGRLDAATLSARFGAPAERVDLPDGQQHWLYPDRGLAIAWQPERGRAVVQVVAPAAFDARLRAPLSRAASVPGSGPTR